MDSSKDSSSSSSTQNNKDANPSPPSFNVSSLMHTQTFPTPMTHEGARYSINPDGHIVSDTEGLNDVNKIFTKKPFILQIPNGADVISCVTQFAQRYQLPITVLSGNGLISEVDFTFPQSIIHPKSIYGCYQIISFSGTYNCLNVAHGDIISCFTVSLVDAQGIFVGGLVASMMKAASTITLVVCITDDLS